MAINTIIFDWDGTMAMTLHLWLEGWHHELQKFDMMLPDHKVVQDFFYEHHKTQVKYPHIDMELSANFVRDHVEAGLQDLTLYAGADSVVSDVINNDIQAALVTSSSRGLVEKGLHKHGLASQFNSVLAGDDGFGHKPSPTPFTETMNRLGAMPDTTLVIGDAAADILAARAANCLSCLFLPDENVVFQDRDYLMSLKPDFTIQSLSQINDLI